MLAIQQAEHGSPASSEASQDPWDEGQQGAGKAETGVEAQKALVTEVFSSRPLFDQL